MKTKNLHKNTTLRICITALFMALNIAASSFGLPVPGGHIYLTDVVICTASILLDPFAAFMVGGVGSFIGDILFYPPPMFVTLVTHGLQAIVISLFSHYIFKKRPTVAASIGVSIGAIIMIVGYFIGKVFIYSTLEYAWISLPYEILQASVGAVGGILICFRCRIYELYNKNFKPRL